MPFHDPLSDRDPETRTSFLRRENGCPILANLGSIPGPSSLNSTTTSSSFSSPHRTTASRPPSSPRARSPPGSATPAGSARDPPALTDRPLRSTDGDLGRARIADDHVAQLGGSSSRSGLEASRARAGSQQIGHETVQRVHSAAIRSISTAFSPSSWSALEHSTEPLIGFSPFRGSWAMRAERAPARPASRCGARGSPSRTSVRSWNTATTPVMRPSCISTLVECRAAVRVARRLHQMTRVRGAFWRSVSGSGRATNGAAPGAASSNGCAPRAHARTCSAAGFRYATVAPRRSRRRLRVAQDDVVVDRTRSSSRADESRSSRGARALERPDSTPTSAK